MVERLGRPVKAAPLAIVVLARAFADGRADIVIVVAKNLSVSATRIKQDRFPMASSDGDWNNSLRLCTFDQLLILLRFDVLVGRNLFMRNMEKKAK